MRTSTATRQRRSFPERRPSLELTAADTRLAIRTTMYSPTPYRQQIPSPSVSDIFLKVYTASMTDVRSLGYSAILGN
jgi:hypothetical protein